jgi:hypothetical protein
MESVRLQTDQKKNQEILSTNSIKTHFSNTVFIYGQNINQHQGR